LAWQLTYFAAACDAINGAQGSAVWLPALLCPAGCTWLLHIIVNTLHPLLLERSLLLLAAMLAVTAETAAGEAGTGTTQACSAAEVAKTSTAAAHPAEESDAAAVQQQHCTIDAMQLLLQHGLLPALEAVLLPAAMPGIQLQQQLLLLLQANQPQTNSPTGAAAAAPAAAGVSIADTGGWSGDDLAPGTAAAADGVGDDIAGQHCANTVYQQPEVLLALLSCLEQLGQEGSTAAVVLQLMPGLPQQLLYLMLACQAKEQQGVLELLLPVSVLFRAGVVPCLTLSGVQHEGLEGCQEGLQQQQQLRHSAVCLHYWGCIAGVLHDCVPDSLDAIDAAWYLLAAGMSSAQAVLAHLLLLPTSSDSSTHFPSHAWVERQLQQLCWCVVESTVPATAQDYATKCVVSLQAALQDVQQLQEVASATLHEALRACANTLESLLETMLE
jgi:hypothetical protein